MIFSIFILPFIGSALAILAASLGILDSIMKILYPIFQSIVEFGLWYIREFVAGVKAILTNLSTLAVIFLLVVVTGGYVKAKERADCKAEVAAQRKYDRATMLPQKVPINPVVPKRYRVADTQPMGVVGVPPAAKVSVTAKVRRLVKKAVAPTPAPANIYFKYPPDTLSRLGGPVYVARPDYEPLSPMVKLPY